MKRSQYNQNPSQSVPSVPAGSATKVAGRRSSKRSGFTLVELLVVMAIIGILVSMLAVAIGPVLTRVQEGAVTVEIKQLDAAIQKFKADNGFFPPSFNTGAVAGTPGSVNNANDMLPYLNLLSPNHREGTAMPGGSGSRLDVWWNNVGMNLDDRSALVFWLSGLCANKQYPLTGNVGNNTIPVAFNANSVFMPGGTPTKADVPRTTFFDFKNAQLADSGIGLTSSPPTSVPFATGIRAYNTPYKNKKSSKGKSYFYRNSGSYPADPRTTSDPEVRAYPVAYYAIFGTNFEYVNPNSFQIYTFGQDGDAIGLPLSDSPKENRDNLANFANGRVETFDWQSSLSP